MDEINTLLTPQQVTDQELKTKKENYIRRVLVGFDQFWNVVLDGLPDETISAHAQRSAVRGNALATVLIHGLDAINADHGQKAEVGDLQRSTTVMTIETKAVG